MKRMYLLTVVFFCFLACGDNVTEVAQETSGLKIVVSADSLGKCTKEITGEMMFAQKENAIYACADSVWKNVSAVHEASCFAESLEDGSGYKIVCDGDSIVVIFNGKNGSDGKNGEAGKAGKFCTIEEASSLGSDFERGVYLVVCGSDTVGTIRDGRMGEGCTITDNGDGSVTGNCGGETVTLYKAFCGNKVYDPDSNVCFEDSIIPQCGGKRYSPAESFCVADSLYPLCGGEQFDPETKICYENFLYVKECAGETYDPSRQKCFENRLFEAFKDDRDGQTYRIVEIGSQTWMAENLNYAYMPDTLSFCYNNSADSCAKYGRLYIWSAALDSAARFSANGKDCGCGKTCSPTYPVRGICPVGWHLPDTTEWELLKVSVADSLFNGNADSVGYALKSASGWRNYGSILGNGSDAFDFGAFPAGYRAEFSKRFINVTFNAYFWSLTEIRGADSVYSQRLSSTHPDFDSFRTTKDVAQSVRCVKD